MLFDLGCVYKESVFSKKLNYIVGFSKNNWEEFA